MKRLVTFGLAALGICTLAASGASQACTPQFQYDFNGLAGSNVPDYTPLQGQDNWTAQSYNVATPLGVTASLGFDSTQALRFNKVGPGVGADASRLNDAAFSLPTFTGNETSAFFQADFGVGYWGNQLALGFDADGNGQIRGNEAGELGPRLNIGSNNTTTGITLVSAQGAKTMVPLTSAGGATGGDWVRLRLAMDFTANGGQGAGSVSYVNLSAGGTGFQPVAGLQKINLELDLLAGNAWNPTRWNGIWLHMEGATNELDNFAADFASEVPLPYCTAKTTLICGPPSIGFSGSASASASSGFTISAAPARANKSGLVVYTDQGKANIPFAGGILCVVPGGVRRSVAVASGGTASSCDGAFMIDWNAFASGNLGGNPAAYLTIPGTRINCQWWGRDSVATGSLLSDALEFGVCP